MNKQFRHIAFTWNNYTREDEILLQSIYREYGSYLIFGREEAPTTGTKHLQGYMQFKKRMYFSKLKKLLPKVHFTECFGTSQENIDYCKKEDKSPLEVGEPRLNERGKNQTKGFTQEDWANLISLAKCNKMSEIEDNFPKYYLVYYKTLKNVAIDNMKCEANNRRCLWLYGGPGVGKSRALHTLFPNAYWKNGNKWWDGYQGEESVILDDLDSPKLYSYLKRWADRYKLIGEVKGGSLPLTYTYFIVSSNFSVDELGDQDVQVSSITSRAVERRFLLCKALHWSEDLGDLVVSVQNRDPDTDLIKSAPLPAPLRQVLLGAGWDLQSANVDEKDLDPDFP